MTTRKTYHTPATSFISEDLFLKIKSAIDRYFFTVEGWDTAKLAMARAKTFTKLINLIDGENPKVDLLPKFLIDLYAGRKTNHRANKEIIEAICRTLKIDEEDGSGMVKELLLIFKSLCQNDPRTKDFAGIYKLFLGGRKHSSIYDEVYENKLEIFENGMAKISNPFSANIFWAYCMVRERKTLEIISFDFSDKKITGIGSFMMFKINEYKKLSYLFPGINFGFDSATKPVIYQALLCTDNTITKSDPIIKDYFVDVVNLPRMECPDLTDTEKLREFLAKA